MAEDFALDLEELRHLHSIAKRPHIVSLLSNEILNIQKRQKETPAPAFHPAPSPPVLEKSIAKSPSSYSALESFSWDQDSDKVKIYVSLEAVEKDKIESVFRSNSFDIKFNEVQGKNYRCGVPKLNKEVVPEKCTVLVKPKRVIITLTKESNGNWPDLHFKEEKFKPSAEKDKDPMSGIMDLMKNMYEDGDDDMKRTIAKAWTDARTGKGGNSMGGYPGPKF